MYDGEKKKIILYWDYSTVINEKYGNRKQSCYVFIFPMVEKRFAAVATLTVKVTNVLCIVMFSNTDRIEKK
jgi:hypothetical protein